MRWEIHRKAKRFYFCCFAGEISLKKKRVIQKNSSKPGYVEIKQSTFRIKKKNKFIFSAWKDLLMLIVKKPLNKSN